MPAFKTEAFRFSMIDLNFLEVVLSCTFDLSGSFVSFFYFRENFSLFILDLELSLSV